MEYLSFILTMLTAVLGIGLWRIVCILHVIADSTYIQKNGIWELLNHIRKHQK